MADQAMTPRDLFARELKRFRSAKAPTWSQRRLADELAELGYPLNQTSIARIESGHRDVSLNDALAIAAALDVSPIHFVADRAGSTPTQLTGTREVPPREMREWMRGHRPLGYDNRFYQSEVDEDELVARERGGVFQLVLMARDLFNAAIDNNMELLAEVADEMDDEIHRQRRAMARRYAEKVESFGEPGELTS